MPVKVVVGITIGWILSFPASVYLINLGYDADLRYRAQMEENARAAMCQHCTADLIHEVNRILNKKAD